MTCSQRATDSEKCLFTQNFKPNNNNEGERLEGELRSANFFIGNIMCVVLRKIETNPQPNQDLPNQTHNDRSTPQRVSIQKELDTAPVLHAINGPISGTLPNPQIPANSTGNNLNARGVANTSRT